MNKEIAHTELLAQYTNRGNNVKEVFSMTYVLSSPIHPYVITGGTAHLFVNVRDSKGNLVMKHTWLNHNASIVKLGLHIGDRIQGQFWAEQYWYSNNYHQNNVRRGSTKNYYRLLYPKGLKITGKQLEDIPSQDIINLRNLTINCDFDILINTEFNHIGQEAYWLSFIQLCDNQHTWNLFNKKNNVLSDVYPPEFITVSKWKTLSPEQQLKLLNARKYTYNQIVKFQEFIGEL